MKLISKTKQGVLYCADSLDFLKKLPDNSIDSIVTDPPYGLSFMGSKWDYDVPSIEMWKECFRVLKHGGVALIFAGSRTSHRMAVNVEDAGFELKDTLMWMYGSGLPKNTDVGKQIEKSNPELYIKWKSYKTVGLKPAYEPIILAMKPNDGTYANNALKHGVAGLNIDGTRIAHNEEQKTTNRKAHTDSMTWNNDSCGFDSTKNTIASANPEGRFPANVLLSHSTDCTDIGCHEDCPIKRLDNQSGITKSTGGSGKASQKTAPNGIYGTYKEEYVSQNLGGLGDSGGCSRYFKNIPLDSRLIYVPKPSKSERNTGCEELEETYILKENVSEEIKKQIEEYLK